VGEEQGLRCHADHWWQQPAKVEGEVVAVGSNNKMTSAGVWQQDGNRGWGVWQGEQSNGIWQWGSTSIKGEKQRRTREEQWEWSAVVALSCHG